MPRFTGRSDLIKSRLERFTKALHDVEDADVRAVHRMRVASRRLRELLPILPLGGSAAEKLARRLRRVTRELGRVRELDVLLMVIDQLRESGTQDAEALAIVRANVEQKRDAARRALRRATVASAAKRVAGKLADLATELESDARRRHQDQAWRWALEARVARRATRVERAVDAAGSVYLPERLHAVRIAVKKLRYGAELAAEATGRPDRATLNGLKRAQMLLGRLHDLQVLVDCVRTVQAALTPPDVNRWRDLDRLVQTLERSCRRVHARYVRERSRFIELCSQLFVRRPDGRSRKAV